MAQRPYPYQVRFIPDMMQRPYPVWFISCSRVQQLTYEIDVTFRGKLCRSEAHFGYQIIYQIEII